MPDDDLPEHLRRLGPVRRGRLKGSAHLEVEYFKRGDSRFEFQSAGQEALTMGVAIEKLRQRLGGNEGYVTDPTGHKHYVSIPPELPDGQGIMVQLRYKIIDSDKLGHRDPKWPR